jgi:hypothetical protein
VISLPRRSVLYFGLAAALSAFDDSQHVALVYNFLGDDPLGARARRGGESLPLAIVDRLYPGDRLSALSGGSFEIEYLDGTMVRITPDTPHTVRAIRTSSRSRELIPRIELRDLWGQLGPLVGLSGEAGPLKLAIPGLDSSQARVDAGQRLLGLDWSGGVAPFSVTIIDPTQAAILSVQNVDQRAVATRNRRTLEAGVYQITIADSVGGSVMGSFTVVAEDQARPPSDPGAAAGPRVAAAIRARALAQTNPEVFGYEAYLQLLAIDPGSENTPTLIDLFRLELSRQTQ